MCLTRRRRARHKVLHKTPFQMKQLHFIPLWSIVPFHSTIWSIRFAHMMRKWKMRVGVIFCQSTRGIRIKSPQILRYWRSCDLCERPLTLKSKVYAERSYAICKNGVGKVAKTGQHGGKQERSQAATSRPREQLPRHALFYAFLPFDIWKRIKKMIYYFRQIKEFYENERYWTHRSK